jgi:hypothetical protein
MQTRSRQSLSRNHPTRTTLVLGKKPLEMTKFEVVSECQIYPNCQTT